MPTNIEVKARLLDRARAETGAQQVSGFGPETIEQEDVFFPCENGRLKLRIFGKAHGELIFYERTNAAEVRSSQYVIARTEDPQNLLDILQKCHGVLGVVRKTRLLYTVGQTRIHIDRVEGLGDFLELEVVMRPGQSEEEGKRIAENLLSVLGIKKQHLLAEAYVDLLAKKHDSDEEAAAVRGFCARGLK